MRTETQTDPGRLKNHMKTKPMRTPLEAHLLAAMRHMYAKKAVVYVPNIRVWISEMV